MRNKRSIAALGAAFILGIASFLMMTIATMAPANAAISFCKTAKNSPCISPVNGCSLVMGSGKYIFAENGDSIIDGSGAKMLCVNGRWIRTAALGVPEVQLGGTIGIGAVVQGPIGAPDPGCNPEQVTCPPVVIP